MPGTRWYEPVRNLVRRQGWDVVRTTSRNPYHLDERYLTAFRAEVVGGGQISLVLDIGAAKGEYAASLRREGYRGRIICFEPQSKQAAAIRERFASVAGIEVFRCALGSKPGLTDLLVSENRDSSSILRVSTVSVDAEPLTRQTSSETVEVTTLDSLVDALILPADHVWMKVDVQGFEAEVLKGGRETLRRVAFVELELSIVPVYEGQPLIGEVLGLMREADFELVALGSPWCSSKTGQILQMDGVFRRRD